MGVGLMIPMRSAPAQAADNTTDTFIRGGRHFVVGVEVPQAVYERVVQLTERNAALEAALSEAHPFGREAGPAVPYDEPIPRYCAV